MMPYLQIAALLLIAFILGYVARKYVEKRWPDRAHALDELAQEKGEDLRVRANKVVADTRRAADALGQKLDK